MVTLGIRINYNGDDPALYLTYIGEDGPVADELFQMLGSDGGEAPVQTVRVAKNSILFGRVFVFGSNYAVPGPITGAIKKLFDRGNGSLFFVSGDATIDV